MPSKCPICAAGLDSDIELYLHARRVHREEMPAWKSTERPIMRVTWTCGTCGSSFEADQEAREHELDPGLAHRARRSNSSSLTRSVEFPLA